MKKYQDIKEEFSQQFIMLLSPKEIHIVKQRNISFVIQNQNLQHSLIETNTNSTNITRIHLAKDMHD